MEHLANLILKDESLFDVVLKLPLDILPSESITYLYSVSGFKFVIFAVWLNLNDKYVNSDVALNVLISFPLESCRVTFEDAGPSVV